MRATDPSTMDWVVPVLQQVALFPWRIVLDTDSRFVSASQLRGIWGAALRSTAPEVYEEVFVGRGLPHERTPAYIFGFTRRDCSGRLAVDWSLVNPLAAWIPTLLAAWQRASERGLGPERERFRIAVAQYLQPHGHPAAVGTAPAAWSLDRALWPLPGDPAIQPCVLRAVAPLRIIREARLVTEPGLADLVQAVIRRIWPFVDPRARRELHSRHTSLMDLSVRIRALPWQGGASDLHRLSGRQGHEVELRGVIGELALPEGPGPLWPLLLAGYWLRLGKATTVGLGEIEILPG